jgi:dihydroflavonol-4-reductase
LLGPGDVAGTNVGDWLIQYVENGAPPAMSGGACITDARDIALAMIAAAERGVAGEFETIGPYYSFEELRDVIEGLSPSRTNLALPELGIAFRPAENTIADVIASLRPATMMA